MLARPLPFYLEDRTGDLRASDFDEAYDRLFLRVSCTSHDADSEMTLLISDTGRRSSSRRSAHTGARTDREPAVMLEFGTAGALGTVTFVRDGLSLPMGQYLRRTSMFSGSLSRKFTASNGEDYRWIHRGVKDQEWSCVDSHDYVVAHYNLRPPEKPAYNMSGNILTIYEPFTHLSLEILTTLTIMRYLAAHKS